MLKELNKGGINVPEKLKISKKEFDEMYELIPDIEDTQDTPIKEETKNFTFEEYTEAYDKNGKKVEDDAS